MDKLLWVGFSHCRINYFPYINLKVCLSALLLWSSASLAMASNYEPSAIKPNNDQSTPVSNFLASNYPASYSSPLHPKYQFFSVLSKESDIKNTPDLATPSVIDKTIFGNSLSYGFELNNGLYKAQALNHEDASTIRVLGIGKVFNHDNKDHAAPKSTLEHPYSNANKVQPFESVGYRFTGSAVVNIKSHNGLDTIDHNLPEEYKDFLLGQSALEQSDPLFALNTGLNPQSKPILLQTDNAQGNNTKSNAFYKDSTYYLPPIVVPKDDLTLDKTSYQDVNSLQKDFIEAQSNLAEIEVQGLKLRSQYYEQRELNHRASLNADKPANIIDLEQLNQALINNGNGREAKEPIVSDISNAAQNSALAQAQSKAQTNQATPAPNTAQAKQNEDNDSGLNLESDDNNLEQVYTKKDRIFYNASNLDDEKERIKENIIIKSGNQDSHAIVDAQKPALSKDNSNLKEEIERSQVNEITKSILNAQFFTEKNTNEQSIARDKSNQDSDPANLALGSSTDMSEHNNNDELDEELSENSLYEAYEELENNSKNRIYYTGTKNPKPYEDELSIAINKFKEAQRNNVEEAFSDDAIDIDPNVDIKDFRTYKDNDTTFFYNSITDGSDEELNAKNQALENNTQPFDHYPKDAVSEKEQNDIARYRQNLLDYDSENFGHNKLNDNGSNHSKDSPYYWQNNANWEVKAPRNQDYDQDLQFTQNYAQSKEEAAIYGDFSLDISTHHDDYIDDIDVANIADYVIATNEEGVSPIANRVLTRTRITFYALRFSDNPFLPINDLQREQSYCINGNGYSCYLVGRHFDGLASLGRNNKRRMIAASELAKAHELYPHISITGADFDHLLHTIVFFRRGCHLKHSLSCRLLLSSYGRFGGLIALGKTTVKNKKLGIRYLEAGCHFEDPRSCANLAAMHLNGYGNFEPNAKKGISLYVRSCRIARTITNELRVMDLNLGIGCLELGRMYLNSGLFKDGTYVEQDYVKAHHYLHHACSLRSSAACLMLKNNFTNHEHIDIPMPEGETYRESGNMNKKRASHQLVK